MSQNSGNQPSEDDADSVYKAPDATLIDNEPPAAFVKSDLSPGRFRVDGWIVFASVSLLVSTMFLMTLEATQPLDVYALSVVTATVLGTLIWIYLLVRLKLVLNLRLSFSAADRYIYILIVMMLLVTALWYLSRLAPEDLLLTSVYLSMVALSGIANILLGASLLRIRERYAHLPMLSWMLVASGLCTMTVVLAVVAVPFTLLGNIALMLLFFEVASERAELVARAQS